MELKLSSVQWTWAEPLPNAIARVAAAGFDAIAFDGIPGLDIKAAQAALASRGIGCSGGVAKMLDGRDLISADPDVRQATQDYLIAVAQQTSELGGRYICVAPGGIGIWAPRDRPEVEWDWACDGLRRVGREASKLGVRIGIEPLNRFETNFINRHDQAVALAKDVGEGTGVILDTFHMAMEERDPYDAIAAAAPWLIEVQVADNNRLPPGSGTYDWRKLLGLLALIDYKGEFLTSEFMIPEDRTPLSTFDVGRYPGDELGYGHHVPSEVMLEEMRRTVAFLRSSLAGKGS